ncbi:MAG: 5-formyltetrahydrofolate cyclo-ligase [Chitinophagaceae bacterium]|jgi:5-formyltetrahydrofolate cyclo-ligase|nr:5-formyltetrahydrofolate cyclo-ligase [Chitinophagaceae bacterium]
MNKQAIRQEYRAKRQALTESDLLKLDDLLLISFQRVELPFISTLLAYWPIDENKEPNLHPVVDYLRFRNPELKVCYPVTDFEKGSMTAIATDGDTPFTKKKYNLYEPETGEPLPAESLDMVLVPLLAVDEQGYRVGYGKGFYDRYLRHCRPECIKAGFSYFEPVSKISDRHEFDVPLDICITPNNVYVF